MKQPEPLYCLLTRWDRSSTTFFRACQLPKPPSCVRRHPRRRETVGLETKFKTGQMSNEKGLLAPPSVPRPRLLLPASRCAAAASCQVSHLPGPCHEPQSPPQYSRRRSTHNCAPAPTARRYRCCVQRGGGRAGRGVAWRGACAGKGPAPSLGEVCTNSATGGSAVPGAPAVGTLLRRGGRARDSCRRQLHTRLLRSQRRAWLALGPPGAWT